jgi:MYXO-CTERM domain-containing protein
MSSMLARARALPSLAAVVVLVTAAPAVAFVPQPGRPDLEATPAANAAAPLRERIDVTTQVPASRLRAWDHFRAIAGGRWMATWDPATEVPSRVWGDSIYVPGSSQSPAIAEAVARAFVADHRALLAPGVAADELELVANHFDGRIRSIGFAQRHGALRVAGGQISVRFLADRLYLVSSQIRPHVAVAAASAGLGRDAVASRARDATIAALGLPAAKVVAAGDRVIVPLIADRGVLGYRIAVPITVDAGADGQWLVYAEPTTGEPLVRVNQQHLAEGVLHYDAPIRWPGGGRQDYPARRAQVTVDGGAVTTGEDGALTWTREQSVPLAIAAAAGDRVVVRNHPTSELPQPTANLTISPGGTARWSAAATADIEAHIAPFVHVQIAKDMAREISTDPRVLTWLATQQIVQVNVHDRYCNAYFESGGFTINFYPANEQCDNTARLADVVYHEFGHALHHKSVIPGVGAFNAAMSEGAADFLSAIINDDPAMGIGFRYDQRPLRHLENDHRVWPDDHTQVHRAGLIYGGAFWHLRQAAIAAFGEAEGIAYTNALFVATMMRATDIPSALIEALAADDDDGDLGNGTPNECMIREAFGRHGVRTVAVTVDAPGRVAGTDGEDTVDLAVLITGQSAACLGDEIAAVTARWEPRGDSSTPPYGAGGLADVGDGVFVGAMPLPRPGDVARYRVEVRFTDDTVLRYPQNPPEPYYELYRGEVVQLYCHDFETDPFTADPPWTSGIFAGGGPDLWQWGEPQGLGDDPAEAFQGTRVVGTALDGTGQYTPGIDIWLRPPRIDVGQYSDVHLQYRRWLNVEDGYYDDAKILANGELAWQNYDSHVEYGDTHTRDREWVFRDVPLSTRIYDGTVQLEFTLTSDQGLEMGGWTIDDLCVVADPSAICGDGTINGSEQCDDGPDNGDAPDACRTNCRRAACGDGIVDRLEECDDGNRTSGDGCDAFCTIGDGGPEDGGCCSASDNPTGAVAPLAVLGLGFAASRRRRRRRGA